MADVVWHLAGLLRRLHLAAEFLPQHRDGNGARSIRIPSSWRWPNCQATFSAAYLVEKWGRRRTLAVYLVASGIFTYLFAVTTNINMHGMPWESGCHSSPWGRGARCMPTPPRSTPPTCAAPAWAQPRGMTRIAGALAPSLGAALMGGSLALVLPLTMFAAVLRRFRRGCPRPCQYETTAATAG
jgi:hypothetical protein